LPASRFNLRMSLADHDRLFIDLLHRPKRIRWVLVIVTSKRPSGRGYADLNGNGRTVSL
jgi:hypothetical protein